MTNDEITQNIKKLQYHVSILGHTVDSDKYPVEALILGMNWSEDEINKVHDIFERWNKNLENGEKMSVGEFEEDFGKELGISYQELKSIISAFYRNGQWTNVCESYVDSFGKTPAAEFHFIMQRQR